MKKVGELLKEARVSKKFTLEDISQKTKIQKKYLRAIEESNYARLPSATFVKGFIQNYAKSLNKNPQTMLAIFRRDFSYTSGGKIIPRSLSKPIQKKFTISPSTTNLIIIGFISLIIIFLFARQIILFYKGPELNIHQPTEGQTIISPFEVSGNTSPEANVIVNNQNIVTNEDGEFTTQLQLNPGAHIITITATDRNSKTTTSQIQVNISP